MTSSRVGRYDNATSIRRNWNRENRLTIFISFRATGLRFASTTASDSSESRTFFCVNESKISTSFASFRGWNNEPFFASSSSPALPRSL